MVNRLASLDALPPLRTPFVFNDTIKMQHFRESMLRGLGYDLVDVERVFAAADQPDVPRTRH